MTSIMMATFAGMLIAISHWAEVYGFYLRAIGSNFGVPALGYSTHVQIATLTRIGSVTAFPIIGFLIDKGEAPGLIAYVVYSYSLFYISLCVVAKVGKGNSQIAEKIFFFIVNRVNRLNIERSSEEFFSTERDYVYSKNKLMFLSILSYGIMVGGSFLTFLLSSIIVDYRATMLMLGPLFTVIGTFVSTTFFDPYASVTLEKSRYKIEVVNLIIVGRIYAALLVLLISIIIFNYV